MTIKSREEAARRAEASTTNTPGTCQLWTRTLFGAPSAGDQDHDGDADAVDGWISEPLSACHAGDRNPPRGVPVAYSGGSHGFGHRAISLGGGKIRSTDAGGSGRVATVDLSWPESHWGLHYLGWSETIDGQPIPGGTPAPPPRHHRKRRRTYFVDLHPNYQAGFDFNKAATEGIQAAWIKCTEGEGVNYGAGYASMIAHAQAADLGVAAYHWLHGGDDAYIKRQAQNLATHIGDKSIPVFVDTEKGGAAPNVGHIAAFIREATALGLNVVVDYLPRWYWQSLGSPSLTGLGVTLHNSAYGLNLPLPPKAARIANVSRGRWDLMGGVKPTFLQFGSRVRVAGMSVDCSVYRGPASDLTRWFKMPAATQPPPPPPPPVVKPALSLMHGHTSGRFDRTPASLEVLLDRLMTRCDLITGTEVAIEARGKKLREKGWHHFRGPNKPGADECFVAWPTTKVRLVAADSVQVTDLTYFTTEGKPTAPVHIVMAVLDDITTTRRTLVTAGHYPSDVQGTAGPEGFWNTKVQRRVDAHKSAVAGTRKAVEEWAAKYQPDAIAITGDWNLNIANTKVRAWFAQQFPGYTPNWAAQPKGRGTLGNRWIDVAFLRGLEVTGGPVVHTTDASDHRYYVETLESA